MSNWIYRWPNGDISVVWARTKIEAIDVLDEIGPAIPERLIFAGASGSVNLFLDKEQGTLEFEGLSESLCEKVYEQYPVLRDAWESDGDMPAEELRRRIETECARVVDPPDEAKTPAGRSIQKAMGLSGALADDWALRYSPEKGKPQ